MKRKILIICLMIMILFALISNVYGFTGSDVTSNLIIGDVTTSAIGSKIQTPLGVILDVIRIVGMGIAMIMILAFGIKYMVSMPNERATMMKQSMVYLLGALLLFGASFIVGIIAKVLETATKP